MKKLKIFLLIIGVIAVLGAIIFLIDYNNVEYTINLFKLE